MVNITLPEDLDVPGVDGERVVRKGVADLEVEDGISDGYGTGIYYW